MSKQCKICHEIKEHACFSKNSGTADKLDQRCKKCMIEYKRQRCGQETKTYPILDFDYESDEWQVGKPAGYVSTRNGSAYCVI